MELLVVKVLVVLVVVVVLVVEVMHAVAALLEAAMRSWEPKSEWEVEKSPKKANSWRASLSLSPNRRNRSLRPMTEGRAAAPASTMRSPPLRCDAAGGRHQGDLLY